MASFQAKIGWTWRRKREKKIVFLFRSYPTGNIKFQKKKKIKKKKKYHCGFISCQNRLENAEKEKK